MSISGSSGPQPAVISALGHAPDRAIRGRLIAVFIDGFLLGAAARLFVPAMGIHDFGGAILALLVFQFLYFFLQEANGATTIGKRRAGLRVVSLDGAPPSLKQIAIRNALRPFDSVPMFYASGLVAVMWSGPARRQRLGDKVADTAVILAPGGTARPTPGWLLPTLTVAAVLLSIVLYGVTYDKYRTPNVDANALTPVMVPGFTGDNSQAPSPGRFSAQAIINGSPAVDTHTGRPAVRSWDIEKSCATATSCTYKLTRNVPGLGDESGQLTPMPDGWHVNFPTHAFKIKCPANGSVMTAMRRASFVVHFEPGGEAAEAHEVNHFTSDSCGEFSVPLDWNASRASF